MEKKEREQLKERFMNLVVDDKREKITVKDLTATAMMIRSTPPDYSVLLGFIEQELDKAREEGRREQQRLDCELYGTAVATDEEVKEMWKLKLKRMRVKAKRELSKLKE